MLEIKLFSEEVDQLNTVMESIRERFSDEVDMFSEYGLNLEIVYSKYISGDIKSAGLIIGVARWMCGYSMIENSFIPPGITLVKLLYQFPEAKDYIKVGTTNIGDLLNRSNGVMGKIMRSFNQEGVDYYKDIYENQKYFYTVRELYSMSMGAPSFLPLDWIYEWDKSVGDFLDKDYPKEKITSCIKCGQSKRKNDVCPVCGFTPSIVKRNRKNDIFYEKNQDSGV